MTYLTSPQKRFGANKFVANNSTATSSSGPTSAKKLTYSQRKALEKEEEEYAKMFQLFDNKAEIKYLDSYEEDKLAASVYGDAKIGKSSQQPPSTPQKPQTSGYDFDSLLKNEKVMGDFY
mmetsp:Transcript_10179/g.17994  ORF Transcript_10179/g.17994 Transcript_10179/m.17994 type:complete len:120 (+) Transcript_10179:248-607(+)|eukprot:CAMPEP_0178752786 /NCGR_PEP_ID=MMETSP0744-20121128/11253_1 /TAXON_ID=913974 /ORGANISM="Nitzschia punctata, Strain CCMP561" /LENGTH=119 /DNA_ID=CAMNT_0020406537 /DNA_START=236 /DNA_END=595 /DNA_ORIENTATION=+